jgi:glycosyltransferase involved in cell wall biosynthesis
MYNNPVISVAIPTYKRCKSVVALVNSIIPQLTDEDELLVVDDGSQDGTADLIGEIERVRLISNQSNEGMLKNWNKCLTSSTNDWICIVHDDDTFAPDALQTIRKAIELAKEPAIVGHIYNKNSLDNCFRYRIVESGSWAALNPFPIPSGVTIHRSIVKEIGLFDERFQYSADIEYFSRICAKFTSIVIENPRVVSFNLHGENYEYKTWGKIDFLTQLEEIEKCLIEYAGIEGKEALEYFHNKMNAYVGYIMDNAYKSEDKFLLRKFCSEAKKRKYLNKRNLRSARIASILNWHPKF